MAKIDAYLRSLEKLAAQAMVLTSNQTVTLRFPGGDRHATQVTSHDQLVAMVREVAPPAALDAIDGGRPARFDLAGAGGRYVVSAVPRPDRWQVQIEPVLPPVAPPPAAAHAEEEAAPPADAMLIERTAYAARGASWLDDLIRAARGSGATDLHLVPGTRAIARIGGELVPVGDAAAIDGEQLERELETALPGAIEEAEAGTSRVHVHVVDGVARCRVHVHRDRHGTGASLRLHPIEPPDPRRLGVPDAALALASRRRGLVLVASPAGGGRTTTLGAMIEHAAARAARVVSIERATEIVHGHRHGLVSQRVVGEPVATVAAALAALADEDADVIAVHDLPDAAAVAAALELALAGRLVLAGVAAPTTTVAIERVLGHATGARVAAALAGAVAQVVCRRSAGGQVAAFEVLVATEAVLAALRQGQPYQLPSLVETGRGQGMVSLAAALADLVRGRAIGADEALAKVPDPAALRALLAT